MRANSLLNYLFSGRASSLLYYSHKAEYYELNNTISSLLTLYQTLSILDDYKDCDRIEIPFLPNGIKLGSNSANVISKLGKAKYSLSKDVGIGHTILFYRQNISRINILSQIHLYNDIVVYVRVSFDYLEASKGAKKSIYQSLKSKYDLVIDENNDNYYIDENNNYLKVFDNGQISVQFFYVNKDTLEEIRKNIPDSASKKGNSEDLIKDLI
ncbi:MAG: hypothetical protein DRI86_05860 [Bacteroidetes bacterium]|nr:MAG: hypothetical protein DRI86_05860 [Bacteroidota bacterium]